MRRFVVVLLFGLVLVPLRVHPQGSGSVTLNICNTGTVDIDVFVSPVGKAFSSHIRPSTCAVVAETQGAAAPAYVGLAFTPGDSGVRRAGSTPFPPWG